MALRPWPTSDASLYAADALSPDVDPAYWADQPLTTIVGVTAAQADPAGEFAEMMAILAARNPGAMVGTHILGGDTYAPPLNYPSEVVQMSAAYLLDYGTGVYAIDLRRQDARNAFADAIAAEAIARKTYASFLLLDNIRHSMSGYVLPVAAGDVPTVVEGNTPW